MEIIKDTTVFRFDTPSYVTLGKFDGFHRGHQSLIREVLRLSARSRKDGAAARSVVFSFLVSPVTLLTKEERRELLCACGIDCLIECPFVPAIITMEPETFVRQILVEGLKVKGIVVGADYRFGYGRRGSTELLIKMGKELGFTVTVLGKVQDSGEDISSTRIRAALNEGDMETVNRLLGYTFFINGSIIHGRRVGRTIGFPTTNLIPGMGKYLPPNGVYAVKSVIDGEEYAGITNIGTKPTVDGHFIGVETYLFNCDKDLYGEQQKVKLLHFIRKEKKFSSVEALKAQILKDQETGRRYFL
ncbi:MAG: bifunctional riboflavin kinase/FAD synthetase [Lachnospiraceae bacterium]|nr:bifunctional riboflavin kinase/FAD synthetase [Lachnospiraceae bacterium]